MSRKPTKEMIDRGVSFALNVKLSSEYSWSQYVSDLYQHMDAASRSELTKPSLVAVPDERTWNQAAGRDDYKFTEGWNACRDAMLAATPPPDVRGLVEALEALYHEACLRSSPDTRYEAPMMVKARSALAKHRGQS